MTPNKIAVMVKSSEVKSFFYFISLSIYFCLTILFSSLIPTCDSLSIGFIQTRYASSSQMKEHSSNLVHPALHNRLRHLSSRQQQQQQQMQQQQKQQYQTKSLIALSMKVDDETMNEKTSKKNYRRNKKNKSKQTNVGAIKYDTKSNSQKQIQTWRIFGIEVDPDSLGSDIELDARKKKIDSTLLIKAERSYLTQPVLDALCKRLKLKSKRKYTAFDFQQIKSNSSNNNKSNVINHDKELLDVRVVRRSLDARKNRGRLREYQKTKKSEDINISPQSPQSTQSPPRYIYVIDIDISKQWVQKLRFKNQPGRMENISDIVNESHLAKNNVPIIQTSETESSETDSNLSMSPKKRKKVIIVGAGPAGLFCALTLSRYATQTKNPNNEIQPILLERGQPVETRGKSIGALIHRGKMDQESNFAFGEGGAGTWSDGKLTTRIGRNSDSVRFVLQTLVDYGAPQKIMVDGSPHLGTDNLVRLLRNMRKDIIDSGGDIRFGAKVTKIIKEDGAVRGVTVEYLDSGQTETLHGDAVVMATGHSARDVYEQLANQGVVLEPKGFATGFRIEHPQRLINKIQYGSEWSPSVLTGRKLTDAANLDFNSKQDESIPSIPHNGRLPVASYRLATNKAFDGNKNRGAYSFCMCPGGQIVPASTDDKYVCVNGMSFSKRDSIFANSALVVTVDPDDEILEPYQQEHGVLAGIAFQRDMERRAAILGGGNLVVPVQSVTDFVNKKTSSYTSSPPSSYKLGVRAGVPCHEIYPESLVDALSDAVTNQFDKAMPGFLAQEGFLHSVETRTSSPVRICRSDTTMQAIGLERLYPTGEGAGFAGGIVSAAVDGLVVAEAVLDELIGNDVYLNSKRGKKEKSVGFDY